MKAIDIAASKKLARFVRRHATEWQEELRACEARLLVEANTAEKSRLSAKVRALKDLLELLKSR